MNAAAPFLSCVDLFFDVPGYHVFQEGEVVPREPQDRWACLRELRQIKCCLRLPNIQMQRFGIRVFQLRIISGIVIRDRIIFDDHRISRLIYKMLHGP